MRFVSTRSAKESDAATSVDFSAALVRGLAPDGGLYVPVQWPTFAAQDFAGLQSLPAIAERLLRPFVAGDALEGELAPIVAEAFNFPAPCRALATSAEEGPVTVLELFHGPTAAFKDFGARFLAACFARLRRSAEAQRSLRVLNILVATSGDTGGAVAAAFHRREGLAVTVLYPRGRVSPTQEQQLTCWGDNVKSFAVAGSFDDCQRMVKAAFLDTELRAQQDLSSANSINLGRLLPQTVYYAASSLAYWRVHGEPLNYIIPSGNLGNAVACIWARHMGLPIGQVILAHNANRSVVDYLEGAPWMPRPSVATLASAMDVGDPSNMERLRALYPDRAVLAQTVRAFSIEDEVISARICSDFSRLGEIWCPHTAIAAEVYERLAAHERKRLPWCLVATASPAKFPEIVEPLIGQKVPVPSALAALFDRPAHAIDLAPTAAALRAALLP